MAANDTTMWLVTVECSSTPLRLIEDSRGGAGSRDNGSREEKGILWTDPACFNPGLITPLSSLGQMVTSSE